MLYITNFANMDKAKGTKVAIVRYKEEWLGNISYDFDLKLLAPSERLFHAYKEGKVSKEDYEKEYRKDLTPRRLRMVLKLIDEYKDENGDITLLCYCSNGTLCHRFIAGKILEEAGETVVYI